jgi:hypothetical protein
MKNLKLNEFSKQQMRQITGGRETETTTIDGKQVKRSYDCTWIYTPYGPKEGRKIAIYCVCGCVYANQGGSSTDANFTANDARNLKSF